MSRTNTALERMKSRMSSIREAAKEKEESVVSLATHAGGGFAIGMLDSYLGDRRFFGLDNTLTLGALATGAAMAGIGGSHNARLEDIGKAGVSIYSYKLGYSMATERQSQTSNDSPRSRQSAADGVRRGS